MLFSSIKNFIKKPSNNHDGSSSIPRHPPTPPRSSTSLKAPNFEGTKNSSATTITKSQIQEHQQTNDATAPARSTNATSYGSSSLKYPELHNKYKLIKLCGEGASSKVYKAYSYALGANVAIKITDKSSVSTDQLAFIKKEISIMKKLHNKNIVKMYDYIESESTFYIILEYCPGGEIFKEIIRFTYFSEDLARHVILQVAHAVKYLHQEIGVAHRDIKPENLLFIPCEYKPRPHEEFLKSKRRSDTNDKLDEGYFIEGVGGGGIGVVKLADFGLSKILWNTTTQTPCGTAGYTAPEIVKVEKYDKSVDLWAIGCVLYTLLCGFPPFYDDNNDKEKLLKKNLKGEYEFLAPWWDEISIDAKNLVRNLLNIDPLKRYTIDQLLNDPWMTKSQKTPMELKIMRKFKQESAVHHNYEPKMEYFPVYVEDASVEEEMKNSKEKIDIEYSKTKFNTMDHTAARNNLTNDAEDTLSSEVPADIVKKNSITAPMVHDQENMMNKERKYKHIFNKSMEYQRENIGSSSNNNGNSSLNQLIEDEDEAYDDEDIANSIASSMELHLTKNQLQNSKQAQNNSQQQHTSAAVNTQPASILLNGHSVDSSSMSRKLSTNTNTTTTSMSTCSRKLSISEDHSLFHKRSMSNSSHTHTYSQNAAVVLGTNHGSGSNLSLDLSRASSSRHAPAHVHIDDGPDSIGVFSSSGNLADSLSAVSFKKKNTLPRTPLPKDMSFITDSPLGSDDEDYDDEDEDQDDDDSVHELSFATGCNNKAFESKNIRNTVSLQKGSEMVSIAKSPHSSLPGTSSHVFKRQQGQGNPYSLENDPEYMNSKMLNENIEMSLDNFCLDMNNSSMLERRRKSSVNVINANTAVNNIAKKEENK